MKKFLKIICCGILAFGLTGCGSREPLSDEEVKQHLSEKGYTFNCASSGVAFCSFANTGAKKVMLYNDDTGYAFMTEESLYDIKENNVIEGNAGAEEMKKDYEKIIDEADVTGEEISNLLEKEHGAYLSEMEAKKSEAENKIYEIGDEITISKDGVDYFKFKVNSVKETSERNEFSDKKPAQVIVINYSYENLNLDEDLYISSSSFTVIDEDGNVSESYPAGDNVYPQECPKGAKSKGEEAYGLEHKSKYITLRLDEYLPGYEKISRNFNLKIG